jgi:hypothetical protein
LSASRAFKNPVKHSDLLQETLRGKKAIREWITRTIQKYKLHFNPLSVTDNSAKIVVAVEMSGTFDGSPVTLDYHFVIESDKIPSLTIE